MGLCRMLGYPDLLQPESLSLQQATADLCLHRKHSNTQGRSVSVSVGSLGPGVHKLLFTPSKHLWKVWGLILIEISSLLPFYWGCSFALDMEYLVLVGANILLSMVDQKQIAIWSSHRKRWAHTLLPCHLVISTGIGEFNSDDHYIYHCGQESLRRNGVALRVNKRVRNAVLGCNLKSDRIISLFPR